MSHTPTICSTFHTSTQRRRRDWSRSTWQRHGPTEPRTILKVSVLDFLKGLQTSGPHKIYLDDSNWWKNIQDVPHPNHLQHLSHQHPQKPQALEPLHLTKTWTTEPRTILKVSVLDFLKGLQNFDDSQWFPEYSRFKMSHTPTICSTFHTSTQRRRRDWSRSTWQRHGPTEPRTILKVSVLDFLKGLQTSGPHKIYLDDSNWWKNIQDVPHPNHLQHLSHQHPKKPQALEPLHLTKTWTTELRTILKASVLDFLKGLQTSGPHEIYLDDSNWWRNI